MIRRFHFHETIDATGSLFTVVEGDPVHGEPVHSCRDARFAATLADCLNQTARPQPPAAPTVEPDMWCPNCEYLMQEKPEAPAAPAAPLEDTKTDLLLRMQLEFEQIYLPHKAEIRAVMVEWSKRRTPNELLALIRANTNPAPAIPDPPLIGSLDAATVEECARLVSLWWCSWLKLQPNPAYYREADRIVDYFPDKLREMAGLPLQSRIVPDAPLIEAGATRREIVESILTVCKRSRNTVPAAFAHAPKVYQAGVSAVETFVRKLHETSLASNPPEAGGDLRRMLGECIVLAEDHSKGGPMISDDECKRKRPWDWIGESLRQIRDRHLPPEAGGPT